MNWPAVVDPYRRIPATVLVGVIYVIAYWGTALLACRSPTILVPTLIDEGIPAIEAAIWLYASVIPLVIVALWTPDGLTRARMVVSVALACTAAGVLFVLYPTAIPRMSPASSSMTGYAWQVLYAMDTRCHAFPSLHAAFALIAAAAMWRAGRGWRIIGLIWASGVLASALLVKQHFLIDLLAGLCVGALAQTAGNRLAGNGGSRDLAGQ